MYNTISLLIVLVIIIILLLVFKIKDIKSNVCPKCKYHTLVNTGIPLNSIICDECVDCDRFTSRR